MAQSCYELEAQGCELDAILEEFRGTLRRINNFNQEDRRQKLRYCAHLEQQARTARAAYALELKALEDEELVRTYRAALRERQQIFKSLVAELELKRNEIDRDQLIVEADLLDDAGAGAGPQEQLTIQKAAAQGDKVQNLTQDAVHRMKHMVADAERIGIDTAQKMDNQIMQMGGIQEGLEDTEYNIKRAKETAKTIAKNIASDRCVQVLCIAIGVCIITIIVLAATKK